MFLFSVGDREPSSPDSQNNQNSANVMNGGSDVMTNGHSQSNQSGKIHKSSASALNRHKKTKSKSRHR